MDERTKELIAIGASVSAHCRPCLAFHLEKARKLGIAEDEIRKAAETGHMVEKGAASAMKTFVGELFNPIPPPDGGCCPDKNSECCSFTEMKGKRR